MPPVTPPNNEISKQHLIEHLSSEITAYTAYLGTFRSRLAFSVLIGPFVLLGSLAIGSKELSLQWHGDCWSIGAAIAGVLSYILMALYGANLDHHVTNQCDIWRRAILQLANGGTLKEEDMVFSHSSGWAYVIGMVLALVAFASVAFLFFASMPPAK